MTETLRVQQDIISEGNQGILTQKPKTLPLPFTHCYHPPLQKAAFTDLFYATCIIYITKMKMFVVVWRALSWSLINIGDLIFLSHPGEAVPVQMGHVECQ